ncbi:MAG: hypothetical protein H6Q71_2833 [Firmicutes bacterium]|nr:hypothetical protein [Bacillota bacterium]
MGCSKIRLLVGMCLLVVMMALPSVGLAGSQDFTFYFGEQFAL